MIKIVIADDHAILRAGLSRLLKEERDFEVLGEASTGREALEVCKELKPDVLLLDLDMPDMDGFETIIQIEKQVVEVSILVLTMYGHEEYAARALQSGAVGFAVKGISQSELPAAIRKVAAGNIYISPSIMENTFMRMKNIGQQSPIATLSDREHQVFLMIARGISLKQISEDACLSPSSVRTYKKRVMDKLGITSVSELTRLAIQHNIVSKF